MLRSIVIFFLFLFTVTANAQQPLNDQALNNIVSGTLTGDAAKQSFKEFRSAFNKSHAYYETYNRFIDGLGVKRIAEFLEGEDKSCHGVAHALGKVIAERIINLSQAMSVCGSMCTYACVHGVFKHYFSQLGKDYHSHEEHAHQDQHENNSVAFKEEDLKQFGKTVNEACKQSKSMLEDFFRGNCAHAIGHAMAKLAPNVRLANDYCKVFEGEAMRYYCETGVFMETAGEIKKEIFKTGLRRSEEIGVALEYCDAHSHYPSACFRFLLPRHTSLGHVTRHATLCSREQADLQRHCFNALGYMARTYVAKNPEEINYVCALAQGKSKQACYSGLVFMKKDQRYRETMQIACSMLVDADERNYCHQQSNEFYYDLGNNEFEHLL